jgi:LysM repeat protein
MQSVEYHMSRTSALVTSTYFVDFTQQTSLPANWAIANYETVTYGPNGAEFTFAKRYDAPYMWTNFYVLFGNIETVVQAAPGTGMISSSVLISDDLDEIDWEWSGNNFGASTGKVQTNYYGKGITGNYDRGTQPSIDSPQTTFHTYTIDWTPTTLTWSVDGAVIRTVQNNNTISGAYQYPQTPMRVQLGLWDGGDADSADGTVGWAGGYTDLGQAPFTMYVKSVTITTPNPCSGNWQYMDTSGSAGSIKCVSSGTSSPSSNITSSSTASGQVSSSIASTSASYPMLSVYTVVSDNTGYGIATKVGIPFTSLAAANPTVNWDLLLIGQVLQILPTGSMSSLSTSAVVSPTTTSVTASTTSTVTSSPATTSSATLSASTTSSTASSSAVSSASVAKTSSTATTTSTSLSRPPPSTIPSTIPISTSSSNLHSISGFVYTSCNTDNNLGARALNALSTSSDTMTVAMCATFCSGYTYMGLEYGRECYCGNALMSGSTSTTDGRCSMVCDGNSTQICGGPYGLSLYTLSANAGSSQVLSSSNSLSAFMTTKPSVSSSGATTGCATVTSTVTTTAYACTTNLVKMVRARGEGRRWWPFFG